jgi:hypothetical protein
MPKMPPRNNRQNRTVRTVQSAASLLQRINTKAMIAVGTGSHHISSSESTADSLLRAIRLKLPATLAPHVVTLLEKPGELVLFTDSAGWAGRLKLALAEAPTIGAGRKVTVRIQAR